MIQDPYKDVDDEKKWRICADVAMQDHLVIKAISPFRGVIQAVVNTLFKAVVDECRARKLIYYSEENYEQFIAIIRRRAAPWTPEPQPSRDVSGATSGVRAKTTHSSHVKPGSAKRTRKGVVAKGQDTCSLD